MTITTFVRFHFVSLLMLGMLHSTTCDNNDNNKALGSPIGYCDGCWCIPGEGESCPTSQMPAIEFSAEWITNLRTLHYDNPMELSLDCDIYTSLEENGFSCSVIPALEEGEACVAEIYPTNPNGADNATCPQDYSYRLKTVPSREEAEKNFELITHEGACGTCSSFQDLSVYTSTQDLVTVGVTCAAKGVANLTNGFECYKQAGFTDACAVTWLFNSINTNRHCQAACASHLFSGAPNNLGPPNCELADCLECDEVESGPIFKEYAGRTRRRSGLLSAIVRPCADVGTIIQQDPCEFLLMTRPPTAAPTEGETTMDPEKDDRGNETSSASWWMRKNTFLFALPLVHQLMTLW